MGGAVGIEAAQVEQRCIKIAALERTEQIVPAGDYMRDVVDQSPVAERHQNGIGERPAFDADAQPRKVADASDAALAPLPAKHNGPHRTPLALPRPPPPQPP